MANLAIDMRARLNDGLRCHRAGNLAEAQLHYSAVLRADPRDPEANHLLGLLAHQSGDHKLAVELIGRAIRRDNKFAPYHLNLGNALQALGEWEQAAREFRRAHDLDRGFHTALYNLGNALYHAGRTADAVSTYRRYIEHVPEHAAAHYNLGLAYQRADDHASAVAAFRKALDIEPSHAESFTSLSLSLQALGNLAEAIGGWETYIAEHPGKAHAHYILGLAYLSDLNFKQAAHSLRQALKLEPGVPEIYFALGEALWNLKDIEKAATALDVALRLRPKYVEAECLLVKTRAGHHRPSEEDAAAIVETCLEWTDAKSVISAGSLLVQAGHQDKGLELLMKGESMEAAPADLIKSATCLPTILNNEGEIAFWRARFASKIEHLLEAGVKIQNPHREIGRTNFFLAYHSLNDRPLQEAVARLYLQACPSLGWTAPHCGQPFEGGRRIRVGFVSHHLKNHTIGKLNRGIIEKLDRERFEVSVFQIAGVSQQLDTAAQEIAASADHAVRLSGTLESMREAVAEAKLDLLYYTDIGMDPFSYFLAFSRLAPVQTVTWGHPVTTGIPNVDYFLSSEDLDLEDAQDYYSEKLVRLPTHPVYYYRPQAKPYEPLEALAPYAGRRKYVCVQSLFKLHPRFDLTLSSILQRDPEGILVLIQGSAPYMEEQLRERFRTTMGPESSRIVFVPRLDGGKFFDLMREAAVLLDTPFFGGGNTSYEAFAVGAPVVSWERPLMRERITPALYRQMGVQELVAKNESEYVDLAVRCGLDADWRAMVSKRILDNCHRVYEQAAAVQTLEQFIVDAVNRKNF